MWKRHIFEKGKSCNYYITSQSQEAMRPTAWWIVLLHHYPTSCWWPEWSLKSILTACVPFIAYGHFSVPLEYCQLKLGSCVGSLVNSTVTKPLAEPYLALTGTIPVEGKNLKLRMRKWSLKTVPARGRQSSGLVNSTVYHTIPIQDHEDGIHIFSLLNQTFQLLIFVMQLLEHGLRTCLPNMLSFLFQWWEKTPGLRYEKSLSGVVVLKNCSISENEDKRAKTA